MAKNKAARKRARYAARKEPEVQESYAVTGDYFNALAQGKQIRIKTTVISQEVDTYFIYDGWSKRRYSRPKRWVRKYLYQLIKHWRHQPEVFDP